MHAYHFPLFTFLVIMHWCDSAKELAIVYNDPSAWQPVATPG
jgi:hypothetical protein